MRLPNITRFQTARAPVSVNDTLVATTALYRPGLITQAIKDKMIGVHPYQSILLRFFGVAADNDTSTLTISGWNFPPGSELVPSGPGHRLLTSSIVLGQAIMGAPDQPLHDGKWSDQLWREADNFGVFNHNPAAAVSLFGAGNLESGLILPTLGYTHILIELTSVPAAPGIGCIWRPLAIGGMALNPDGV